MDDLENLTLAPQQRHFVDNFVQRSSPRTLLVAPAGSGKSVSALMAMRGVLQSEDVQRVLIVTSRRVLVEQWRQLASRSGYRTTDEVGPSPDSQITITTVADIDRSATKPWVPAPLGTRWLLIFDAVAGYSDRFEAFVADVAMRFPSPFRRQPIAFAGV